MRAAFALALTVASLFVVAGCSVEVPAGEEGPASQDEAELKKWCRVDGKKWIRVGESAKLDCNTCTCLKGGSLACTKMACPAPDTCSYGGNTYKPGASFPSTDGCNTCTCGAGGSVGCTEKACLPKCDPASEPNRSYIGTSPASCMLIRYTCVPNTTSFSNDCGCGCEQAADCPEWINCMPGPGATSCADLRAKCPLSQVAY